MAFLCDRLFNIFLLYKCFILIVQNLNKFVTYLCDVTPFLYTKMSRNYDNLERVQQEIKDLLKKETRIKKKEQKGQLDDEEEIELEGLALLMNSRS